LETKPAHCEAKKGWWTLGIWTVGCDGDLSALWFSKKSKHIVDNQENDGKGEDEITQKTPKIIINYSL